MKYLLVVLVIVFVLWLMFGRSRGSRRDAQAPRGNAENMVRCAHCGVHLPRSEALMLGGSVYCSAAHRDAGPTRG